MMTDSLIAYLNGATRQKNSKDGNPVWTLHTSVGDYLTDPDAYIGFEVDNRTNPEATESWVGKKVTFSMTPRGRVQYWRLINEEGVNAKV